MGKNIETMTLEELRAELQNLKRGGGMYARNMIGLVLEQIDERFGEPEAEKAIKDFHIAL